MSGSVNMVIIAGNLAADPEVRRMPDGNPVVTLRVVTNETWRDKSSGERREKAEFHRIVIFNEKLAEVAEKYVRKGSKLYVQGQLQTRKWTDQQGQDKYSTEIVLNRFRGDLQMLDSKGERQGGSEGFREGTGTRQDADMGGERQAYLDDEIPF